MNTSTGGSTTLDDRGGSVRSMIVYTLIFVVVCGVLYPALATVIGGALFPAQSRGSLIERDGVVVGSALVAQPFVSDRYLQPRPSAAGYDVFALAGSNWAPSNPALRERIAATSSDIAAREGVAVDTVPIDLVTASGSGIDPHISPEAAFLQIARIARARGVSEVAVREIADAQVLTSTFGLLGRPRINVLEANLALDALATQSSGQ
jgi:K+-transporting ATPase ATPase C chain